MNPRASPGPFSAASRGEWTRRDSKRIRALRKGEIEKGPVAYWMSRDQRVHDNWALLYAQDLAIAQQAPLVVVFCLVPSFSGASFRNYRFMLAGLKEVEDTLGKKNIPFCLTDGHPANGLTDFLKRYHIGTLVTDFDPLRVKREWKRDLTQSIEIPFVEVDAHNIVPCWVASEKQEYGAYTLRPKLKRSLNEFLEDFPAVQNHPFPWQSPVERADWVSAEKSLKAGAPYSPVDWILPGETAALDALREFLSHKIHHYGNYRNDPNKHAISGLSPYLHFGHLSSQRVLLEIRRKGMAHAESAVDFIEELLVRKELSDNYCFYNQSYDTTDGLPDWSRRTLNEHRADRRQYIYSFEEFEQSKTHDDLWNAAQMEMVTLGKMHGYMRMYWAKKILEWTGSPEEAYEIAIQLNDKYELDGRDPNGYTGIAWSIGGLHDRAWNERAVFGKIRYMSYNGCKSKFKVKEYIEHVRSIGTQE
jgi:deoxyribodipyrimidine photo-lyase